jgi:transcriptional regulator with XRE-family HTH domain
MKHKKLMKIIGRNIFDRRTALGMTQSRLSEKSGISESYISQLESHMYYRNPSIGVLCDLATALKLTVSDITSESKELL